MAHTLTVADLQLEMVSVHQRLRVQALKPEEYEKVCFAVVNGVN